MDLTPYISRLQRELATAARAGGPDAEELAERLTATLESATRLVLLEALSTAAGEITLDLDDATVDVRLRGTDPELVVTSARPAAVPATTPTTATVPTDVDDEAGGTARFSLRLPERVKPQLEEAATRSGLSVNAWLVRAITAALENPTASAAPTTARSTAPGRTGGWVR
jgi:hypothetical protein